MNQDVKINVPEFDGKTDGDRFIDWFNQIDRVLAFKCYGDPRAVTLIETKLTWKTCHMRRECPNPNNHIALLIHDHIDVAFHQIWGDMDEETFTAVRYFRENISTFLDVSEGFYCESMAAVEMRLEEMGIKFIQRTVEEGGICVDQLFFHDPDGSMIEICNCDNLPVIPLSGEPVRSCSRINFKKHQQQILQQKQQQQQSLVVQQCRVAHVKEDFLPCVGEQ
ncbi:hypothetical protein GIB67_021381 [Kingdonia uniflora]|uniref:VOC domain-containing protein n=1 Tax=Kingdonia uniflora TaxID=39325 RepID=A0A7J7MCX1_9MAGN|nr:hypothetical protein GIB67_021381 [Kingdonia uniflora]